MYDSKAFQGPKPGVHACDIIGNALGKKQKAPTPGDENTASPDFWRWFEGGGLSHVGHTACSVHSKADRLAV